MPKRIQLDFEKWKKNPGALMRAGIGLLLAANLVAAAFAFKPWSASLEDLQRQAATLRQQLRQQQMSLEKTRTILNKVELARKDGDQFMEKYLIGQRSMASSLTKDLEQTARKAQIRQKDTTFSFEPIEGSDTLTKAIITATYDGTYADLIHFVNLLDRSERFLIIESLGAAPQQNGMGLGVTMKLSAIVREGGQPPDEEAASAALEPVQPAAPPPHSAPPQPQFSPRSTLVRAPSPASPAPVAAPPGAPPAPVDPRRMIPLPRGVRPGPPPRPAQ